MTSLFSTLLCLLLLPLLASAQSPYRNISLGSSISTVDGNRSWVSPSGDFAFGFYPTSNTSTIFYVAIWFNRLTDRTIVWTARTSGSLTDPIQAPAGSTTRLAGDGGLLVENQQGEVIWSAIPRGQNVTHASMLDSGNFVIAGGEARWQSFDSPTDTLLPSQPLLMNSRLSSGLMQTNLSDGRFQLSMNSDGNLVLYSIALPTGNHYRAFWTSDTVGTRSQLVLNSSGELTLVNDTSAIRSYTDRSYTENPPTWRNYYYRLTLDSDGGLRQYAHPRNEFGGSWIVYGQIPDNICTAFPTDKGSGACGLNSYCSEDQGRAVCSCPPGYSFVDPSLRFLGCKPDLVLPQRCGGDQSNASTLYDFREMNGVDWPGDDYEDLNPKDEVACQEACLVDCFCAVALHRGGSCCKKKLPLSNGREAANLKVFIKVARTNVSTFTPDPNYQAAPSLRPNSRRDNKDGVILAISVLLGSSGFINLICLAAFVMIIYPTKKKRVGNDQPVAGNLGTNLRLLSYKAIVRATNNFREELGSGAFGSVFKGLLPGDSTGTSIAVKRLDKGSPNGQNEFQTEIRTISKVHHKNLVPLLGYCDEGPHKMLVYEFMSNGSLAKFLFSNAARPSWDTRMQIAFEIARGLVYLHEECSTQIIHCDIKQENILLDEHLNPRISDFGLAKLLRTDQSRTMTGIRGTRGYVAPEWFKRTAITAKVDVFSYGVLLMELICCRKNVVETADDAKVILTDWAYDCYLEKRVNLLVEGDEEALYSVRTVERLVKLVIWCIQEDPSLRPQMKKVNLMLEGMVEVPIPPNPYAFVSSLS